MTKMDAFMAVKPKKKKKRGKKGRKGQKATPALTPGLGKSKIPPVSKGY